MSDVKIKELDKSLIHRANSNSMSGKRGDISAHEYEVYCQKVMSWNIPDSRKQKIVDQIYAKWSEQLRHEAAHVSVAVAGPARYNAKKLDHSDTILRLSSEFVEWFNGLQEQVWQGRIEDKNATDAMRENLKGICDFEVRLPVDRAPRGRREEQLRMASNQGAEIAWLVMAATCHETFGYGRDRLARLKQNSMNNYKQYLEWEKEDKDLALDRLRRCVQDALKEDLRVTDTDDRKGMLSTPGRGPSVYETAAVYSEIFRRARAARAVAPLAVYSAAKYDETMTAARKRASVMLGL